MWRSSWRQIIDDKQGVQPQGDVYDKPQKMKLLEWRVVSKHHILESRVWCFYKSRLTAVSKLVHINLKWEKSHSRHLRSEGSNDSYIWMGRMELVHWVCTDHPLWASRHCQQLFLFQSLACSLPLPASPLCQSSWRSSGCLHEAPFPGTEMPSWSTLPGDGGAVMKHPSRGRRCLHEASFPGTEEPALLPLFALSGRLHLGLIIP